MVNPGKRPRVVYWNNIPAPYMVERFNAVAARGSLEFEAWFSARSHQERSWNVDEATWRFNYRFLPSVRLGRWAVAIPTPLLRRRRPNLMVSLYESSSFVAGWWVAHVGGVRTAFWTEVTFDAWVRRRLWKELLKRYLFRRVDAIITVGEDGRRFALRYGAEPNRILYAPHVIDVEHFRRGSALARPRRTELRRTLGVSGTVILYVGRLWEGKGLSYLIEAFGHVQRRRGEVTLLLVGDGVMEPALRARALEHRLNVVFAGFRDKAELPAIYVTADVFVFPTLGDPYGLVVDEAMACSLPVITTSAVGELGARMIDGETGIVVAPANTEALREAMERCIDDPESMKRMGAAASEAVAGRTPQRWAADFERAVFATLKRTHHP